VPWGFLCSLAFYALLNAQMTIRLARKTKAHSLRVGMLGTGVPVSVIPTQCPAQRASWTHSSITMM
jgi:hypothetical protein